MMGARGPLYLSRQNLFKDTSRLFGDDKEESSVFPILILGDELRLKNRECPGCQGSISLR